MKLSREKTLRLSHLILHALNHDDGVEFFADVQQIRGEEQAHAPREPAELVARGRAVAQPAHRVLDQRVAHHVQRHGAGR